MRTLVLLESMLIPNFSSFILFSMVARPLPLSTRRLFETENREEYPSIKSIIKFVKQRIHILENAGAGSAPSTSKQLAFAAKKPATRTDGRIACVSAAKQPGSPKCHCCSGDHGPASCAKFAALSIDERYSIVCTYRLCMVCLSPGHMSFKCSSSCSVCQRRHHKLLYRDQPDLKPKPQAVLLGSQHSPLVLLGSALVHVYDAFGQYQPVRALIDLASQISRIGSAVVTVDSSSDGFVRTESA